MAIYMEQNQGW